MKKVIVFLLFKSLLLIRLIIINKGTRLKKIKSDWPFVGHENPKSKPLKIESTRFFFNYTFLFQKYGIK